MKRLFLFAILSAFTLCLSAQSMPSVSENEESSIDTTNNLQNDTLNVSTTDIIETGTSEEDKGFSVSESKYLIYIIGFGTLLVILLIVIFVYLARLSKRLNGHRHDIKQLEANLVKIKDGINDLSYTRSNKSGNGKAFTNTLEISEIKKDINELRSIVDKIQKSVGQPILGTASQPQQPKTSKQTDNTGKVSTPSNAKDAKPNQITIDVNAQANGTFKVTQNNPYFEITADTPDSRIGTFVVKNLDSSKMKTAISNRHYILEAVCDILGQSGSSKIVVIEPGTAEKIGNEWRLINKAKISIE